MEGEWNGLATVSYIAIGHTETHDVLTLAQDNEIGLAGVGDSSRAAPKGNFCTLRDHLCSD